MILGIIFGLALVLAFMQGYRYGLVNTIARVIGYFILGVVALLFAHPLGIIINNFLGDALVAFRPGAPNQLVNQGTQFLGAGLGFTVIYLIGGFFVHSILKSLHFIKKIPIVSTVNALLGGILNLVLTYIICFFTLQLLSVMNIAWVQQQFVAAPFLNRILDQTPILSNTIYQWWLNGNFRL
ncbi:CvpA family protein [Periweissella fabaria]|uniref:CvpA family protein n=1 Tax=Periweissella fabaria TaxID=546157 RepID=A0ABM8Z5C7_9LACO|nr:CvpA family protein [Periweissella fabaria]MCM0596689.1 CvpA family protein [Periweissella fabaria]CAH0416385.1 hypothetical protein WFA24289_00689 [Periweissella fabaria]